MIKRTPVSGGVRVQFSLPEERVSGKVSVVGEFNDWNPRATPLRRRANGTRSASVVLEPGRRYAFRYVGEGDHWYDEETADSAVPNGFGGWNSVVQT
jgi:1,4-alpha-glucan branching enzyme